MHTHAAPNPVPAPKACSYWVTQLLAWTLLLFVLLGLYLFQSDLLSRDQVKVLVLFFFTGIGISHLFLWGDHPESLAGTRYRVRTATAFVGRIVAERLGFLGACDRT